MALHLPSLAVVALVACMVLPGCKRKLTDANLSCVKMDMHPKEVESILGPPNESVAKEMELQTDVKTLSVVRYVYEQNGRTVVIHFVDGKLVGQEGSFEK